MKTDAVFGDWPLDDGGMRLLRARRRKIIINAACGLDTPCGHLGRDFLEKDPAKMHYKRLADVMRFFKSSEEGVRIMSDYVQSYAKQYADQVVQREVAKVQKQADERVKEADRRLLQVAQQAVEDNMENVVRQLLSDGVYTPEQIVSKFRIPLDTVLVWQREAAAG